MDESLTKIEKEDFKLSSRSYLGNFNELDYAPMLTNGEHPRLQSVNNPLDSPNIPFSSNLSVKPFFKPFQSPKIRMSHPNPNEVNSKHYSPYSKKDYYYPPRRQFQDKIDRTREVLKNIIREYGVQFYMKVLEEYHQKNDDTFRNSNFESFDYPNQNYYLGKRQNPNLINQTQFLSPKNCKISNNSFQIQKINLGSTKNESLFSILNGNIKCPNPFGEKTFVSEQPIKVTSIEKNEIEDTSPKNILIRLYNVICGKSPRETWTLNWDLVQIQIFWLLLYKMGVLPEDWQTSLQNSNSFPKSSRKLKSVSHKTNMLTNRILIKILNRYFYQARDKNCPISESVLKKLLQSGETNLIQKDFIHFSKIVRLKNEEKGVKRFIDISKIQNQYLNRKMKDVLCNVLLKEDKTPMFYAEVREEVLNDKNQFQLYHKNKVFKKLRMAVSKVETFLVQGGKLPKIGLEMNQKQKTVFKKLKIPPPLHNWVDAFSQVDSFLSIIPSEN